LAVSTRRAVVSFVDDQQLGGWQLDLSGSHCAGIKRLDRGDLHSLGRPAWKTGLNDAVVDPETEQFPRRLLDQLAAVGEEENTQAFRGCLPDDGASDDRFAGAGGRDKQDSPPTRRDLSVKPPYDFRLIGAELRSWALTSNKWGRISRGATKPTSIGEFLGTPDRTHGRGSLHVAHGSCGFRRLSAVGPPRPCLLPFRDLGFQPADRIGR
jgi:hypothetical protein